MLDVFVGLFSLFALDPALCHPLLTCLQMVPSICRHQFDQGYIIEKTYPFSPSTSLSPHFLSHIFACHHIVEVANACPYTDMSDLSSGMVKF